MKDKLGEKIMTKLREKSYSYLLDDGSEKKQKVRKRVS